MILTLPRARNSFLELAGSSRVYVSRAILIECEPTSSNTTLLQLSETDEKIANRLGNA